MNLTAATITIYFMGLVNFDALQPGPPPDPSKGYAVLVPFAAGTPEFQGVRLDAHEASLVITRWGSGASDCSSKLGGTWDSTKSECVLSPLKKSAIKLAAKGPFRPTADFANVPRLQARCATLGKPDPDFAIAARMEITHGTLDACLYEEAWVATLSVELEDEVDNFFVDKNKVRLPDGARVFLRNEPAGTPSKMQEKHFYWHYLMRQGASTCSLPPAGTGPTEVTCRIKHPGLGQHHGSGWPTVTGVGCSVTQYP